MLYLGMCSYWENAGQPKQPPCAPPVGHETVEAAEPSDEAGGGQ